MALVKPTVNNINAFDATSAHVITFTASGGDQVVKNEIKVVTNDANETVKYNHTVTSNSLSHTIPANTLTNGQYYKVAIRTYDSLNNTSAWSNYQPFRCYSTPVISLSIVDGQQITTSSVTVTLTYNQSQSEKVDHAIIDLYSSNNVLISSSGNLYNINTPPINFTYNLNGLNNNSSYKLVGTVTTIEGTVVTKTSNFTVHFSTVVTTDTLTAEVFNCDGYINLQSNTIVKVTVASNPNPLVYIDNEKADLLCAPSNLSTLSGATYNNTSWAKWSGLVIPQNFLFRAWFYPARQPFDCIRIINNNSSTYVYVSLKRRSTMDYLSIDSNSGTKIDIPLNMFCNGNTKVFLWMKVIGTSWDVQVDILETTSTKLDWNSTSTNNIKYNVTSDIAWKSESKGTFTPRTTTYNAINNTLTTVIVANGIFDHLNLTLDTNISYTTDVPQKTQQTLLNIDFNGSISSSISNYTRLLLKRKDDTTSDWINLVDMSIPTGIPTYIDYDDKFVPKGIEQTYSLIAYIDSTPSEPVNIKVTPSWAKYCLSDRNNRFTLNYAVIYSNHTQNIQNGVFLPIGARYPIVIQNGEGNYKSGSLQFKVLGYQYEENKRLDRLSINKQKEDMLEFLTNGKVKCLTDFNGGIYIFKVINSPQISYDANWGNGIPTISFDWVEQGKYNNYEDMLNVGFVDYIVD